MMWSLALHVFVLAMVLANAEERVVMEPGVKLFSSNFWIKDDFSVSNLDMVDAVFVMKHKKDRLISFEKELLERSNPTSGIYGQWFSREQVFQRLAPSSASVQIVLSFLESAGIPDTDVKVGRFRDVIRVKIPAMTAQTLLQTEFSRFRSESQRNVTIYRVTQPYSLPASVAEVVQVVDGIVRFPVVTGPLVSFGAETPEATRLSTDQALFTSCGDDCNGLMTPDALEHLYSITRATVAQDGNSIAVAEFQQEFADVRAVDDLLAGCDRRDPSGSSDAFVSAKGTENKAKCEGLSCAETLMDVQYTAALASPIPTTVWYMDHFSVISWLDDLTSAHSHPLVASVSFALESDAQVSDEYMDATSVQFMKAGVMGITLLEASGDQGVWGHAGYGTGGMFNPEFPASCPYVTTVGGTNLQTKSVATMESAWTCSGGGFSDHFLQPSYQSAAVDAYFQRARTSGLLPPSSYFNSQGRGFPDISAIAGQTNPYCVALGDGIFVGTAGTSGATSVVASMIALLNNERLAAGKSSLGFINPLLYANPHCFHDIQDYSKNSCLRGVSEGFISVPGWDPTTGLGSPNYKCLLEVISKLE